MKLYIDDIRTPKYTFDYIARNSADAINWMSIHGCPEYISFDHDLGEDDTSMIIIKWMVEEDLNTHGKFIPHSFTYNVHSANPVGKSNIEGYLKSYLNQRN